MPVLDLHPSGLRANTRHAITAEPSLLVHQMGSQGVLVQVVVVIRVRTGTMLGKASRLIALDNRPHTFDSRNIIKARARVTSGSSEPSFASRSISKVRAPSKFSSSIK